MQWDTVKEQRQFKDGNVKVVSFVDKKEHTDSAQNVWITFHQQLKVFKQHIFYVTSQYAFYTKVRDNIQSQEAVIHVDFSENYECKWESAIQSAHYGALKKQISLHTGFFQVSKEKVSSYCGVSDTLDHEPFAIWTYLLPILDKIKMCHPSVKKLYFFSDGPTAQCRQKINFYLLAHFVHVKGFDYCSWNFLGAGHGKGIPDGIGGTVKRAADRVVKFGTNNYLQCTSICSRSVKVFCCHPPL